MSPLKALAQKTTNVMLGTDRGVLGEDPHAVAAFEEQQRVWVSPPQPHHLLLHLGERRHCSVLYLSTSSTSFVSTSTLAGAQGSQDGALRGAIAVGREIARLTHVRGSTSV
jgi:hypothetical protein